MKRRTFLGSMAAAGGLAVTGSNLVFAQSSTPVASPADDGVTRSGIAGVPDAYTKMPKIFSAFDGVPGEGGEVTVLNMIYGAPPVRHDENTWWKGLEERLGVTWKPIMVPNATYGEKCAAVIASGDLPDLFYLNFSQANIPLAKYLKDGAFLDLTPYLTGESLKQFRSLSHIPEYMWNATKLDGKIYGVPCPTDRCDQLPVFRRDWADSLLGHMPKTGAELAQLMADVTTKDPDGNGKSDTWGMARFEANWDLGLIYPMHRVPNNWKAQPDGTFVKDIETDEFWSAVEFLAARFSEGSIHADAAGMQYETAKDLFQTGHTLFHADGSAVYGGGGYVETIRGYYPNAVAERLVPFGVDGGQGVTYNAPGIFGFTGIPASITDEKRVLELLRILDWLSGPFASESWLYRRYGIEHTHFEYDERGWPSGNDLLYKEMPWLVNFIGGELLVNFGDPDNRGANPIQDTKDATAGYAIGIDDPSAGLYSPSLIDKGQVMDTVVSDGLTDIITGRKTISSVDQLIADWKSRGGDTVRGELEAAYAANQG